MRLGLTALSRSVVSDSLQPRGLQPTRLLCPWDFLGKNTGVGCQLLLQGNLLTQESNRILLCLLYWQLGSWTLASPGKPRYILQVWTNIYKNVHPPLQDHTGCCYCPKSPQCSTCSHLFSLTLATTGLLTVSIVLPFPE